MKSGESFWTESLRWGAENPVLIGQCPKTAIEARKTGLRTVRTVAEQMVRETVEENAER